MLLLVLVLATSSTTRVRSRYELVPTAVAYYYVVDLLGCPGKRALRQMLGVRAAKYADAYSVGSVANMQMFSVSGH